ncbi:MAG TPA: nuclear transport factor 2 family protein [Sphingobium sp.]
MDQDLERKLRELVDRQEIWSLLLRYARGIDRRDRELVRSCYWDDAVDDHHSFVGDPDAFIDWVFENNSAPGILQHHGLNNHFCEVDGDNAYSETYYTFIGANSEPPHLLSIGRYMDHFQRRDGVWKMANRVTVIEKNFDLHDAAHDAITRAGDTSYGPLLPATRDRGDLSYMRPVVPRRPKNEAAG